MNQIRTNQKKIALDKRCICFALSPSPWTWYMEQMPDKIRTWTWPITENRKIKKINHLIDLWCAVFLLLPGRCFGFFYSIIQFHLFPFGLCTHTNTKSTRIESFIYKIYIYLKRIVRFEYLQFNMRIHVEYGDYNVLSNRSALSGISACP